MNDVIYEEAIPVSKWERRVLVGMPIAATAALFALTTASVMHSKPQWGGFELAVFGAVGTAILTITVLTPLLIVDQYLTGSVKRRIPKKVMAEVEKIAAQHFPDREILAINGWVYIQGDVSKDADWDKIVDINAAVIERLGGKKPVPNIILVPDVSEYLEPGEQL